MPEITHKARAALPQGTPPAMTEDDVKALQDLADVLSIVLADVPDRVHKAALRDALKTLLDVAIENDLRGRYHLFRPLGEEDEGGIAA